MVKVYFEYDEFKGYITPCSPEARKLLRDNDSKLVGQVEMTGPDITGKFKCDGVKNRVLPHGQKTKEFLRGKDRMRIEITDIVRA